MWNRLLIACCCAALFESVTFGGSTIPAGLRLSVTSSQKEYLLGEPVALNVALANTGKQPLDVVRPTAHYGIVTLLSEDGVNFIRYRMGIFGLGSGWHKRETLNSGDTWALELRILYQYDRPSRLAFERPGTFFIKVRYTLLPHTSRGPRAVDSSLLAVHIRRPDGLNAHVWKRIKAPEFLYFLQSGLVWKGHEDIPLKAVELLKSFPESAYASALKHALGEYYRRRRFHMTREETIEDPQLERIRVVTGIVEPPEGPFPDDPRLEVEITTHFPKWTTWEDVLQEVSRQTGVPLGVAPEFRQVKRKGVKVTESLRRFMRLMEGHNRKWVRDGDGYRLIPAPESETKAPPDAQSNEQ